MMYLCTDSHPYFGTEPFWVYWKVWHSAFGATPGGRLSTMTLQIPFSFDWETPPLLDRVGDH